MCASFGKVTYKQNVLASSSSIFVWQKWKKQQNILTSAEKYLRNTGKRMVLQQKRPSWVLPPCRLLWYADMQIWCLTHDTFNLIVIMLLFNWAIAIYKHPIECVFKVPISSKFLFSHLILRFMQWTSAKKCFYLDKKRFCY